MLANRPARLDKGIGDASMDCPRPRAADDFDTIRQRLEELRREREAAEAENGDAGPRAGDAQGKSERRRRERLEGWPPPWAPTIFAKSARRQLKEDALNPAPYEAAPLAIRAELAASHRRARHLL